MAEKTKSVETAASITAPCGSVELGGKTYAVRFDHNQIRQTELCWQRMTGGVMGYLAILNQADRRVYTALCALLWGACHSGALEGRMRPLTMEGFDKIAGYHEVLGAGEELVGAALSALDTGRPKEKNA